MGNAFGEVLQKESENTKPSNDNTSLKIIKDDFGIICGKNHCPGTSLPQFEPPSEASTFILFGILNGMILLSIERELWRYEVWLLFPISAYTGFELTIIWFDFSKAFTTCLLEVYHISWTNILFGNSSS